MLLRTIASLLLLSLYAFGQGVTHLQVYPQHMTVPTRYDALARAAQLQGIIKVRMKIGGGGRVLEAKSSTTDALLLAHPLLQDRTEAMVREWTFRCLDCQNGQAFEYEMKFTYVLKGEAADYNDAEVVLDLPYEIRISGRPPICDHCPVPGQKHRRGSFP
jgi:hypothetical protein